MASAHGAVLSAVSQDGDRRLEHWGAHKSTSSEAPDCFSRLSCRGWRGPVSVPPRGPGLDRTELNGESRPGQLTTKLLSGAEPGPEVHYACTSEYRPPRIGKAYPVRYFGIILYQCVATDSNPDPTD